MHDCDVIQAQTYSCFRLGHVQQLRMYNVGVLPFGGEFNLAVQQCSACQVDGFKVVRPFVLWPRNFTFPLAHILAR